MGKINNTNNSIYVNIQDGFPAVFKVAYPLQRREAGVSNGWHQYKQHRMHTMNYSQMTKENCYMEFGFLMGNIHKSCGDYLQGKMQGMILRI